MANPFARIDFGEADSTSILPDDERSVPSESVSRQGSRSIFSRQGSKKVSFGQDGIHSGPVSAPERPFRFAESNFAETPEVPQDLELGAVTRNGYWGSDKTYNLSVVNLSYKVMEKKGKEKVEKVLLNDVNARALHGEILAVMGPSGSSKTTFLDAIAGRIEKKSLEGSVLVNGNPTDSSFMKVSQYVMQDDALFPLLTVTETLMFSARFRLPGSLPYAEKLKRVEFIVEQLGLKTCAQTYVGNDLIKGVSGGERRRVSIGVELIHDPAALFLDEPTSGLDSTSALHVIEILSMLAVERKRLVILTIHQPSFRILDLLNKVLILARGNVVYHGRVRHMTKFFEDLGRRIPVNVNVVEFALDTIEQYQDDPVGFEKIIAHQKEKYKVDEFERLASLRDKKEQPEKPGYGSSFFWETLALADRTFKTIFRTPELFFSRIGLAVLTGVLFGTIFLNADISEKGSRQRQSFLVTTIALLIYSTNESLPIFLAERQIFIREVSRGAYRPAAYTLAQAVVFTPFLLLVALIYVSISYFMVDLVHSVAAFFICVLTVLLTLLLANAFVSVFGAIAPNFLVANAVSTAIFTFMFIFSGFFIPRSAVPDYWIWLHYLSIFKYPYEILIWNEFSRLPGRIWFGTTTTQDLLKNFSAGKVHIWNNVAIMIAMIVVYRIIFYLILRFRTNNIRK